jgi:hypothetical protein
MESPQIGGFVEGQQEIKSPAWSGKTTDGLLASRLDCHKTAKMMSYEDALKGNLSSLLHVKLESGLKCLIKVDLHLQLKC